jgi:hypothetical protein
MSIDVSVKAPHSFVVYKTETGEILDQYDGHDVEDMEDFKILTDDLLVILSEENPLRKVITKLPADDHFEYKLEVWYDDLCIDCIAFTPARDPIWRTTVRGVYSVTKADLPS